MKPIPTLSSKGFVTDPVQGMVELYKLFCASEFSQSNLFEVHSYKNLLRYLDADRSTFTDKFIQALRSLYEAYYERVDVDVRLQQVSNDGRYNIIISVDCVDGGMPYTLSQSINDIASQGDITLDRLLQGIPL